MSKLYAVPATLLCGACGNVTLPPRMEKEEDLLKGDIRTACQHDKCTQFGIVKRFKLPAIHALATGELMGDAIIKSREKSVILTGMH